MSPQAPFDDRNGAVGRSNFPADPLGYQSPKIPPGFRDNRELSDRLDVRPWLRRPQFPGLSYSVTFLTVTGGGAPNWQEFNVAEPCILIPLQGALATNAFQDFRFHPSIQPDDLQNSWRAAGFGQMYLWAPGKWYLHVEDQVNFSRTFIVLPCEDESTAEAWTRQNSAALWSTATVALAAGVVSPLSQVTMGTSSLIIQNTGANPMRIACSPTVPAAAVGHSLAAGATLQLRDSEIAPGALLGFSTLGTTVNVQTALRYIL